MGQVTQADIVVVGASAAGLAVARCLEELGLAPVVLEAEPQVGQLWRSAYDRLHLHTPRGKSGLPHMPMPASFPRYPSRQQVVAYLEDYAAALKHPPLLRHRAVSIERNGNVWETRTHAESFASRHVVIATGNTRKAVEPAVRGMERYEGTLLHTSRYHNGAAFRGKRVLVVGFGNSACEIAIDLSEHGASPTLSVRGPVNVVPRDIFGIPVQSLTLVQRLFGPRVADALFAPILRLLVGDIARYGLQKSPYGPTTQIAKTGRIPLLDIGTMALIKSGAIAVKPGVSGFTPTGVRFADGRAADYDAVLLGTGYRAAIYEFLHAEGVLDANGKPLVSGAEPAQPGLWFCGFRVVAGGTLGLIRSEAPQIAARIREQL